MGVGVDHGGQQEPAAAFYDTRRVIRDLRRKAHEAPVLDEDVRLARFKRIKIGKQNVPQQQALQPVFFHFRPSFPYEKAAAGRAQFTKAEFVLRTNSAFPWSRVRESNPPGQLGKLE